MTTKLKYFILVICCTYAGSLPEPSSIFKISPLVFSAYVNNELCRQPKLEKLNIIKHLDSLTVIKGDLEHPVYIDCARFVDIQDEHTRKIILTQKDDESYDIISIVDEKDWLIKQDSLIFIWDSCELNMPGCVDKL